MKDDIKIISTLISREVFSKMEKLLTKQLNSGFLELNDLLYLAMRQTIQAILDRYSQVNPELVEKIGNDLKAALNGQKTAFRNNL